MKTTYFKRGIAAVAVTLFCAAAGVSCADDIVMGQSNGAGSLDGIYENSLSIMDESTNKTNNTVEFWNDSYTTNLKLNLTKSVPEGFTALASFDAAYLAKYNAEHGTDYLLYPADKVTFANQGVFSTLDRGAELSLEMTIAGADMVAGQKYLVPVAVSTQTPGVTIHEKAAHCVYIIEDMRDVPNCYKGDNLPKGFLYFEVNDANPLNLLEFELENGKLLWDVVCLFSANINHDSEANRPYLQNNPNVQFLLDNNETFLQPLRKRGVKVVLGVLGNHDQAGVAQLSAIGAREFAAELARYCEAYNLDGVNFDDEYSASPDTSNPLYTSPSAAAAARLCYETKKAMPDKLVTVFSYGLMSIGSMPTTVEDQNIAKWMDIAVANYGGTTSPKGEMTYKACSGCSTEFNLGGGSDLSTSTAQRLLSTGYGWFMGFAPDPMKTYSNSNQINKSHWQNIFNRLPGAETLYGSKLKAPKYFYKKDDTTRYRYPEDLPDTK